MSNDTDADLTALIDGRVVGFTSAAPWGSTITSYGIIHTGRVRPWLSGRTVAGGEGIEDVTVTEVYVPLAEVERLTRERDDARLRAESGWAAVADLRTRLADAEATIQRVRDLADEWDRQVTDFSADPSMTTAAGITAIDAKYLRRALDGPQDGGEGR